MAKWFRNVTVELWISFGAMVIAGAAFVTSAYQVWIGQHDRRLSVRPHLQMVFYSTMTGTGWRLSNDGLGPALVRSFSVYLDGIPQRNWIDIALAIGVPADSPDKGPICSHNAQSRTQPPTSPATRDGRPNRAGVAWPYTGEREVALADLYRNDGIDYLAPS